MMIKSMPLCNLPANEFIPQAVIGVPIADLAAHANALVASGVDDFDAYEAIALELDSWLQFAVKHYRGHPKGAVTMYFPQEIQDINEISAIISQVMRELSIDRESLVWQRADDPYA